MEKLTFEEFHSMLREGYFEGKKESKILSDMILKSVDPKDIQEFYPKGLFVSDRLEFYVFKDDSLLVFATNGKQSTARVFKFKDLVSLEYAKIEEDERKSEIVIKFSSETFILQSFNDTHEHWSGCFAEKLRNILRTLS